jgi:hypothetical protein
LTTAAGGRKLAAMNQDELKRETEDVQAMVGIRPEDRDGKWGGQTAAAVIRTLEGYGVQRPKHEGPKPAPDGTILHGDGTWPFTARIVGEDIVCENVVVTCFGGWGNGHNADPQDSGNTASGRNTKHQEIEGVSIAMDSRQFPGMAARDHAGYLALEGAPFPKIPWGTKVEVTIGGKTFTPKDGIVDLGPGKRASKPGAPHALDLTPLAARLFDPQTPIAKLATGFYKTGANFRILGAAKYAKA